MNKKSIIGAIVMVISAIAVIVISGCVKQPKGIVGTGEGKGYKKGIIKATVTLDDTDKIIELELLDADNTQTPDIGGKALPSLRENILAKGTFEGVDVVSGASMTSYGVFDAVEEAVKNAKANKG